MKLKWLSSPTRWKDSFTVAFAIIAVVETLIVISSISLDFIWGKYSWIIRLLLIICLFLLIVVITFIAKYYKSKKGISIKIRGINVNIKQGNIFEAKGWKVIAFNEFFDTTVDDVVIAHNTLNPHCNSIFSSPCPPDFYISPREILSTTNFHVRQEGGARMR